MKPELKRIENTLDRLEQAPQDTPLVKGEESQPSAPRVPSFSVKLDPAKTIQLQDKAPILPKLKTLGLSSHIHSVNPVLALELLREISELVAGWHQDLKYVLEQIQLIYEEGPLIDGWLESHSLTSNPNFSTPRKATMDGLMNYVEELTDPQVSYQTPRPGYRLCGVNEYGQVWSRDCPPQEVPSVSLAIARYQKLQQLLVSKQNLETRLEGLTETLVMMRSSLNE